MNPNDAQPNEATPTPEAPAEQVAAPVQPEPSAQPAPEPAAKPTAEPVAQPNTVAGDAPTAPQTATPQSSFYEEYMAKYNANEPVEAPKPAVPDMSKIDYSDDKAVEKFFAEFADSITTAAEARAEAKYNQTRSQQQTENQQWSSAHEKYPELVADQNLATIVQLARMSLGDEKKAPEELFAIINNVVESRVQAALNANTGVTYQPSQPPNIGGGGPVSQAPQAAARDKSAQLVDIQQRGAAGQQATIDLVQSLIDQKKI